MISVKVIFCQFKLIFTIQEFIVFQDAQNVTDINYFFFMFMHKHRQIPITLICFVKQLKVIDLYRFDHNKSRQEG